MLTSRTLHVAALAIAAIVLLSSCGSASTTTDSGVDEFDGGADSDPSIADTAPIDPLVVEQLGRSLTGAPISTEDVDCITTRSDGDSQLTAVLAGASDPNFRFSPEAFTALSVAIHGCVENSTLAASLLALSGEDDADAQSAFAACVGEALDDDVDGDLAYVGLAALRVGFDVPEGASEATNAAARSCVTRAGLANQFAANTEQASGFAVEVDRECLAGAIDDAFVDAFWVSIIDSEGDGPDLSGTIDACSEEYDSGLPKEVPADYVAWSGSGALAGVDPATRNGVFDEPPPMTLDPDADYEAVLTTGDGEIRVKLFADAAPVAVNNFVSLAREGYYDGTTFHRVLAGFMAQGGDPTGTGTGGPGYSFEDEESGLTDIDRRGLLAMANSGPDTNGSQFFITFEPATHLNGNHVVFGEVIDGDDVLEAIDLRDPAAPLNRGEPLVSVEIIER